MPYEKEHRAMPSYAYKLEEPKHLLGKMERELGRFQKDTKWASDHAYNFAVTVWHMTDWLWRNDRVLRPQATERFGCKGGGRSPQEFQRRMREECTALNICYDLANGAKHFELARRKRAIIAAEEAEHSVPGGVLGSFVLGSDRLGGTIRTLVVRLSDGSSVSAEDVFKEAVSFWFAFSRKHGVLPPHARRRHPRHEERR